MELPPSLTQYPHRTLTIAVEKGKLKGAIGRDPAAFARALASFLYSGQPWTAFDAYAALLKRNGAGGWASATYFLFGLDPSHWLLVRPQFIQDAAARLGYPLDYSADVRAPNYQRLLAFADWVFRELEPLGPRDRIDVYTFLYVTNADGYLDEVVSERSAGSPPVVRVEQGGTGTSTLPWSKKGG